VGRVRNEVGTAVARNMPRMDPDASGGRPPVALLALPGVDGQSLSTALHRAGVHVLSPDAGASRDTSWTADILASVQSTWWAPPEYRAGWMDQPEVLEYAERQKLAVDEAMEAPRQGSGAVWFDERHPLLIDLWLRHGAIVEGVLLVWVSPDDAVDALRVDGIKRAHAIALWEHAARHALTSMVGSSAFVCSAASLAGDSVPDGLSAFLSDSHLIDPATSSFAATPTQSATPASHPDLDVDTACEELMGLLEQRRGGHTTFAPVGEVPLSAVSDELLDAHRSLYRVQRETQGAWRLAEKYRRESEGMTLRMGHTMAGVDFLVTHLINAV
jgi:hypothetical protein